MIYQDYVHVALCIKSPYSELFLSAFSQISSHSDWIRRDTEYLSVFNPNKGKCGKNVDQNNSEYELFLRSVDLL